MDSNAHGNIRILGFAIALGVLGDLILRDIPWGLNATIWGLLFVIGLWWLDPERMKPMFGALSVLALIALSFAWRDSQTLRAINVCAFVSIAGIVMVRAHSGKLLSTSLADSTLGVLASWIWMVVDFPALMATFKKKIASPPIIVAPPSTSSGTAAVANARGLPWARGVAVALPLLLIFGALFASADDVFRRSFTFDFDMEEIVMHVGIAAAWTWVAGAVLWRSMRAQPIQTWEEMKPPTKWFGFTELIIVLGSLVGMFAVFVWIQIRYFFGGKAMVVATTGLSYAEYARKGFFELLAVAALVLPILLLIEWLSREQMGSKLRWIRGLCLTLVGLLFVIMASAILRLQLYVSEYGLTEARFYPAACMAWLALVFVVTIFTILRGRRDHFAFWSSLALLFVLFMVNIANPEALIAKTNLNRAVEGKGIDTEYLNSLSADAYPEISRASGKNAELLAPYFASQHKSMEYDSWASWDWSRYEVNESLMKPRD